MGGAASVKSEEEIRQMDAEQLAKYAEDNTEGDWHTTPVKMHNASFTDGINPAKMEIGQDDSVYNYTEIG